MDYYDRDGNVVDLPRWAALVADLDYKRVGAEDVLTPDGRTLWVSTVWLGIDHGFMSDGPPLIFETMVFERGMAEDGCWRYGTEAQALAGHHAIAEALRAGDTPP